jgi:ATP-dependent DNA helicase PIF1
LRKPSTLNGPGDETIIPVEFLRTLNSGSLLPGELILKISCPLILLRNLAPGRRLCNGSRMILLRMSERVLECGLMGGDHDGETILIPRISLTPSNTTDFTFKFSRQQFPVRLAFALTINKSQGQSVKFVGLDLQVPVFSHGELYVALSRATSGQRVKILLPDTATELKTIYVVYPEVLLD